MLSLKSQTNSQPAASRIGLLDLPPELLKSILDHIYDFDDLLSASLVSKGLRDMVLPILFGSINLTFSTRIQRQGETILDFLSKKPRLQKYVREMIIRPTLAGFERQPSEFAKLGHLSPELENLCAVRIAAADRFALRVLELSLPQREAMRVSILDPLFKFIPDFRYQLLLPHLRDDQAAALSFRFHYTYFQTYGGLGGAHCFQLDELGDAIGRFTALRSLSVVILGSKDIASLYRVGTGLLIQESDVAMPALQELHLTLPVKECKAMDEGTTRFLTTIPWSRLRRLSLTGNALIEEVLQAVYKSSSSLRSLHLKAMSPWFMPSSRRYPLHNHHAFSSSHPGIWSASRKAASQAALFLERHPLEELMLEGFDMAPSFRRILCPELLKLKLHMCELLSASSRMKFLQAADLQVLVGQAPNLEHLELDVGRIANLWHTTAVPGVDVDVRIYQVLDAITTLPHLKRLRLFPQYCEGDNYLESKLAQPLTDDAAVRLFRRLKEKSASLETLAVSSDNHVANYIADFDPMSWELRAADERIILTVRQANHDYEQKQVWVGERRLTTEIKRFSYQKPYIPEFEGWMMEC